jgi:hypothetical protein
MSGAGTVAASGLGRDYAALRAVDAVDVDLTADETSASVRGRIVGGKRL